MWGWRAGGSALAWEKGRSASLAPVLCSRSATVLMASPVLVVVVQVKVNTSRGFGGGGVITMRRLLAGLFSMWCEYKRCRAKGRKGSQCVGER